MLKKTVAVSKMSALFGASPILTVYLTDDTSPKSLQENAKKELETFKFRAKGFKSENILDLLNELPLTLPQKKALFNLIAGILHKHKVHARQDAAEGKSSGYLWPEDSPKESRPYTNHWVSNIAHLIEETLHLCFLVKAKGEFPASTESNKDFFLTLVASLMTDSEKPAGPRGVFTHHLDASDFWTGTLSQAFLTDATLGLSPEDSDRVNRAILGHQFLPPYIMAIMASILLPSHSPDIKASIIKKIGNITDISLVETEDLPIGSITGRSLIFTEAELRLLKEVHASFEGWFLPQDWMTQTVAQADAMQYPGMALYKIVPMRGPGTSFVDGTLSDAYNSVLNSGPYSSSGASEMLMFAEGQDKALYTTLIRAARNVIEKTLLDLREELKQAVTIPHSPAALLVATMPKETQEAISKNQFPFLDTPLPIEGGKYVETEATRPILEFSKLVRSRFTDLFYRRHTDALATGQYLLDTPATPIAVKRSLSNERVITTPDA